METLRLFCDVARYHSFSQAAAEHGLTQSAVSQRISALEKKLGAKLIDRSVRPPALTPAGEIVLSEARELVDRYDNMAHRLSQMRSGPSGHVKIDAIYSAGIELLNLIKEGFESLHPRVKVDIHYRRPDAVHEAVRHEECDLGILSYPKRWPGVGVLPLRDERMAVVCSPTHALARRGRVVAAELESYPMIAFEHKLPVARQIKRYLRDNGANPPIENEFDNIDTIKNAVAVTDAFSILPCRTVHQQVQNGVLAKVDLDPPLVRSVGLIYPRRKGGIQSFTPAVQAFIDYLLAHAGPQLQDDQPGQYQAVSLVGGRA